MVAGHRFPLMALAGLGALGLAGPVVREITRRHTGQHDDHVETYREWLHILAARQQLERERLAKLERDKAIIDAAEAKRLRRQAKRLKLTSPKETSHG